MKILVGIITSLHGPAIITIMLYIAFLSTHDEIAKRIVYVNSNAFVWTVYTVRCMYSCVYCWPALRAMICNGCSRRSVNRPSVVRPTIISPKLSKIDPQLLWYAIRKLAPLVLLPHWDPPFDRFSGEIFGLFAYGFLFDLAPNYSCCNCKPIEHDRRLAAGVVNCCKRSATVRSVHNCRPVLTPEWTAGGEQASIRSAKLFYSN